MVGQFSVPLRVTTPCGSPPSGPYVFPSHRTPNVHSPRLLAVLTCQPAHAGAPSPCGQPAEARSIRTNGPVVTATSVTVTTIPGGTSLSGRKLTWKHPTLSPFAELGPGVPGGSDGREIEFVSVVLASGDSRPVPSVDGLALLGEVGDPWPGDEVDELQPTGSRNNAPTSELEQMNRNSLTATPIDTRTEQTLRRPDE